MSDGIDIVVTAYGHDCVIDKLAISIFTEGRYGKESNSDTYCDTINSLELKKGSWVIAKRVNENAPFYLNTFFPFNFDEVMLKLDNRSIQKLLREINNEDLSMALSGACCDVKERVFTNMSSRAAPMFREKVENMGRADFQAVRKSQDYVLENVRSMANCGEITIGEVKEGDHEQ